MNERIRELADKARFVSTTEYPSQDEVFNVFAKLIVKECATVCEEIAEMAEVTNTGEMARKTKATAISCSNFIKNRFGVEE